MCAFQITLRILVTVSGIVVILLPLINLLRHSRREKGRSIGTGRFLRRWPVAISTTIGLLIAGCLLWKPIPVLLPEATRCLLTWTGFIIFMPAICLYLSGLFALGKYFGISTFLGADLDSGHRLIQDGPFHFVRHPMYLAVILAAIGAFLVFRTWAMLVFLPMSTVVFLRASQEEKLLAIVFGDQWRSYARQVPMWIPRLLANRSITVENNE